MGSSDSHLFTISHLFHAPRELVWRAWTVEEHLQRWLGPKGFHITPIRMEQWTDGEFHYQMSTPNGHEMWGKWTYIEIFPPERQVAIISFTDENGDVIRHPLSEEWPEEILSVTEFREQGDNTLVTVEWSPYLADENEIETFEASRVTMTLGWRSSFDKLDAYLGNMP
jgi:uncharacterized protein YndB with AHSA1/START domain